MSTSIKCKKLGEKTIYYSLVEKESGSSLSYSWRLLVVLEEQFIGYVSKPNMKRPEESARLDNLKTKIPFK